MTPVTHKSKPILIVEDNRDLLDCLKMLLEIEGFAIITAENGKEALEWLKENPISPGLIFLDMNMPEMDGLEFIKYKETSRLAQQSPVVIFSAGNNKEVVQGAVDWVRKPIEIDDLLAVVNKYYH